LAPTLSGVGDRAHLASPSIDLDTHVTDIASLLFHEDLDDVVLVGHSYGGMVITGAADRATGRVGKLVYLDAAHPDDGQSLMDVTGGAMSGPRQQGRIVDGVELILWPSPDLVRFFGVTDPEEVAWMTERLTPHPWPCFEQPLQMVDPERFDRIPQYHLVCTQSAGTLTNPRMEQDRAEGRYWEIDTGHDLMITEPEFVASVLVRVAAD
ncbi:MAG TPA: alpha/beta hydrolase, partial [Acidimicrobiales bacterium]